MASFQIHEDQENKLENMRLRSGKNVPIKRSALGTIALQANNIKTNLNILKPVKNTETTKVPFSIHVDDGKENIQKDKVPKKHEVQEKKEGGIPSNILELPRQPFREIPTLMAKLDVKTKDNSPLKLNMSIEVSLNQFDFPYYGQDTYEYLLEAEKRAGPKPNYLNRQPDITNSMRMILVDWLVEVGEEYQLLNETLFITVSMIDRFLSYMSVVSSKLQLLGVAAMFLASKYEEIYPPTVHQFTNITDNTYTNEQLLRMERLILKVMKFDISLPNALTFIDIITENCKQTTQTVCLTKYICELSLLDGDPYLQFAPSVVASSAIALARNCLEEGEPWSLNLQEFTGYELKDLKVCVGFLSNTHSKAKLIKHQAILEKYKSRRWLSVSGIDPKPLVINSA